MTTIAGLLTAVSVAGAVIETDRFYSAVWAFAAVLWFVVTLKGFIGEMA